MYTDSDPDYRDTHVHSGIPPPSMRDIQGSRYNNNQQNDLSRYNPQSRLPSATRNDTMRYSPYSTHDHGSRNGDDRRRHQQPDQPYHRQHQQQHQHPHYPASSQLHPVTVEAPPPPLLPATKPIAKLDMRTSTDFIECGKEDSSTRLSLTDLCSHIHITSAKTDVDYDFLCSTDLVRTAMELRVKGSQVPDDVRTIAKSKSNPFDCIGKHIFMNRDAMKLAALDATFHLTPSEDHSGKMFTFADLCGGPGGFSEYLFWRVHQSGGGSARGYGMTLQSTTTPTDQHWHLENIPSNITVNFTQIDGIDGTGDLYKKSNILEFDAVLSNNTKKRGVDLVVADGCQRDDSKEPSESGAKRLILCQVITMLTCLKQDGSFVCKFFDIFEEFTADLVWLLYQLFDGICVTKPLTSDPSNSERYLVCKKLRFQHPTKLIDALLSVNEAFDQDQQMGSFVPRQLLEKDEVFSDYIKMRNMKFLLKQIDALEQMETYIADLNRPTSHTKEKVQSQCLQEWNLQVIE